MNGIKLSRIIAAAMLLLAIANLPYGYYRFLRIAVTLIAGVNAYVEYKKDNQVLLIIFLGIAILFNPIFPIYFSRGTWMPIDLIIGIFFGVTAFTKIGEKK
ncbi:MAG: hypothetical protein N2043_09155 [Ignavibacterium sp.]|nr:hypothetical protein [Ignavibacterium sp.]